MDYIIIGIYVFAILIILLSFINLSLSMAFYISYTILVPYLQLNFFGISLSYNLVNFILLLAFFIEFKFKRNKRFDYKIISPFLFLFLLLFFLTFFANTSSLAYQLNLCRVSFMLTCFTPFILWNLSKFEPKILIYIKWALIVSITIAGIYGIFLIKLKGLNPYTSFLSQYFGENDIADIYSTQSARFSFTGANKVQSTMIHPMRWALYLSFLIILFLINYLKENKKWYWLLILLLGFNLLFSGVRTGIVVLIIGYVYFIFMNRRFKIAGYGLFFFIFLYIIISLNTDLANLFYSFFDIYGTEGYAKGSSIALRFDQLQGVFNEIKGFELLGKGYGWHNYYISKFGDHPTIVAFESLLFIVLTDSGIIGICIYIVFFSMLFRLHRNLLEFKMDVILLDSFVIVYIAYTIGTGEYGFIQIFSLLYTFLLSSLTKYKIIK